MKTRTKIKAGDLAPPEYFWGYTNMTTGK
jgi:hypothetical protein